MGLTLTCSFKGDIVHYHQEVLCWYKKTYTICTSLEDCGHRFPNCSSGSFCWLMLLSIRKWNNKSLGLKWVCCHMTIIPEFERLTQGNCNFEASLDCKVTPCLRITKEQQRRRGIEEEEKREKKKTRRRRERGRRW